MLSFIEEVAKIVHVWMETSFMQIGYYCHKMFLKMALRKWKNAAAVVEHLNEFFDVCSDTRKHVIVVIDPFGECFSEHPLYVSYEEKKRAHMTGRHSGYLIMENHR